MKQILILIFIFSFSASAENFKIINAGDLNPEYAGSDLYIPDNINADTKGVVVLHGSTVYKYRKDRMGKLSEHLASAGYLVFELCYFECPGNKSTHPFSLINYDVERTYQAFVWFSRLPMFSGKFGLFGLSRGAEQALLLSDLMGRENRPVQPAAIGLHSPIPYIWGSFDWRWTDDQYGCWLCKDGGDDCFSKQLSDDDKLMRRHLNAEEKSIFTWKKDGSCGEDPRAMDLTKSYSYLWRGQPIPVTRQWSEAGPQALIHLKDGYRMDPTQYSGPFLFFHGGKDQLWSPDFSRSLIMILKSYAHADRNLQQLDERPVISKSVDDEGVQTPLGDLTSVAREGIYKDPSHWHQFYLFPNADHAFSDVRHSSQRYQLALDFFNQNL